MAGSPGFRGFFLTISSILPVILIVSAKLNVPRVLLPYSDRPPRFQLSADTGCYSWSTTRPDVIKIWGAQEGDARGDEEGSCSASVWISCVARGGGKTSVGVLAEDKNTGLVLRADVIVDRISSLMIVTKTHELYKEETPEQFQVRAYDEQGNEFSSLAGMVFKWNIEAGRTGAEILRFMSWTESPYNTEAILEDLETEGKQGNKVLLEGIKTGSAKVTVRVVDSLNPSVAPAVENLMVVANLFLQPPLAYVMPGALLQYSATQYRGSRMSRLTLPSAHHQLAVDAKLASLNQETATLTATHIGSGQVELLDQNVDAGEVVKTPTAQLHVVPPSRIQINCIPAKSWTVLVGGSYTLQVEVFDQEANRIFLSDNLVIDLQYDSTFIKKTHSLENGTLHDVVPLVPGQTDVKATLRGVKVDGKLIALPTPLSSTGTLDIFKEMTLDPPTLLLPWDPVTGTSYETKYAVVGGAAPYTWTSSNLPLATVSQMGISGVSTKKVGESSITAAMTRAVHNKAKGLVSVEPAVSLALLESELEFLVGSNLVLPLALYQAQHNMFSRCLLPYNTVVSDKLDFSVGGVEGEGGPGCAALNITGLKLSHTKVGVEFSYADEEKQVTLKDSTTVATYNPLVPVFPSNREVVLAVESKVQLVWEGGPQPWPLQPSSHYHSVTSKDENMLKLTSLKEGGGAVYVYSVECLQLGETVVTLSVGNKPSSSLPKPVVASSSVKVICGTPASIHLTPLIHAPQGLPPCPAAARAGRIATQAYRDLDIGVSIRDSAGREFAGVDTIQLDWKVSDPSLAKLASKHTLTTTKQADYLPGKPYQTIQTAKKTGQLDVTASLPKTGFLSTSGASSTLQLQLVEDARVDPAEIVMFQHAVEQKVGKVLRGSGYFLVETEMKGVAEVKYESDSRRVLVSPLQPANTNIIVKDLCLSAEHPAQAALNIRGVVRVELEILDKIQLGNSVVGTVKLFAANNQLLPDSVLEYVTLTVNAGSQIISVGESGSLAPTVTGDKLGQTSVTASVQYHGVQVSSAPTMIQVFPPLRIEPRNVTLLIGAAFQVVTSGGPSDALIQFFLTDELIGQVSNDGLITGSSLGSCTLVGRAVGRSSNGQLVEYSRDSVNVHVRPLSSLRLQAPTQKIVVGGAVPIYLLGQDDAMDSYSFGSALPGLEVTWTVHGTVDKGSIQGTWESTGFSLNPTNAGVAVFKGLSAGKAVVKVALKVRQSLPGSQFQVVGDQTLHASIELVVLDHLQSLLPHRCSNHVLVSPGATLQLKTNADGKAVFRGVEAESGMSVSRRGLVTGGSGPASLVAVATLQHDAGASQQTGWLVETRSVHYLLLQSTASSWSREDKGTGPNQLPRGGKVEVEVSCHDILGRKFDSCAVDLVSRPSRFDLVKSAPLTNSTFTINTIGSGLTVLKTTDRTSGHSAWAILQAGNAILTPSSMAQGDVADFSLSVKSGGSGKWSVEPAGILDLSPKTGVAVALEPGSVRVKYSTAQEDTFYKDITIAGSTGLEVSSDLVLTKSTEPVMIPIRTKNSETNILTPISSPLEVNPAALFSCRAEWSEGDINQVYRVKPVLTGTGWACQFTLVEGGSAPVEPVPIQLTVEMDGLKKNVVVRYMPLFQVSSTIVEVGPDGGVVRVSGHVEVLVRLAAGGEGVHVETGWLEDGQLVIPIRLHTPIPSQPHVMIRNSVTGQVVKVEVQASFQRSGDSWIHFVPLLSQLAAYYPTLLFCILIVCVIFYLNKPAVTKPPPPPKPVKAEDTTAASPMSPTPFLWSVDNSPCYGSPIMKRSPPSQARNLSQFSYS